MPRRPAVSIPLHPQGYPALGLAARTLHVPKRPDASTSVLRKNLESWEASMRGEHTFEMRSMERLPLHVATEAAHVYAALREQFPVVAPGYVDLASHQIEEWYKTSKPDNQPLAVAVTFESLQPLRDMTMYRMSPTAVLEGVEDEDMDLDLLLAIAEAAESLGVKDVWATGSIDICRSFETKKSYTELMRMRQRVRRPHKTGTTAAVQHVLSPFAYALVHEFGHLVDAELQMLGPDTTSWVYGELSAALYGIKHPRVEEYSKHLVNYPTATGPGRHAGGKARASSLRSQALTRLAPDLGRYATVSRDELFAESFVALFAARDKDLRLKLCRFRAALQVAGLAVSRRPGKQS